MKITPITFCLMLFLLGCNMETPRKIHYQKWINAGRFDPSLTGNDPLETDSDSRIQASLGLSVEEWVDLNDQSAPKIIVQEIQNNDDSRPGILEYCAIVYSDIDGDEFQGHFLTIEAVPQNEYVSREGSYDISKARIFNTTVKNLPWEESDRKLSRLRVWGLAPDFVMGPLEMRIGSNRVLHRAQVEAQNLFAKPRTSLPEEFQPSERTWTDLGIGANVFPEGIQIRWDERDPEYPKLLVSFNLPWNTSDQVKLDMDPFILQGLDVPEGIKIVTIIGMTRAGPLTMKLALPAVSNGLGRCFGRVSVDLAKTNHFHHWTPITSLYAVSRGELAGPLPGLPKAFPEAHRTVF